jgi:hypothetical protein
MDKLCKLRCPAIILGSKNDDHILHNMPTLIASTNNKQFSRAREGPGSIYTTGVTQFSWTGFGMSLKKTFKPRLKNINCTKSWRFNGKWHTGDPSKSGQSKPGQPKSGQSLQVYVPYGKIIALPTSWCLLNRPRNQGCQGGLGLLFTCLWHQRALSFVT